LGYLGISVGSFYYSFGHIRAGFVATQYRINQEIRFLYLKKAKMNEQLYYKHLECAATWPRLGTSIQQIIDNNLQGEMEICYEGLNKKLDKLQNNQQQHSKWITQGHRQEFYLHTVNLTNIKFTKEEQELLDKGMQYNIQQTSKTNWTNLVVETERTIRQLETKTQDAYHILAAKKVKQLCYTLKQQQHCIKKTNISNKKHTPQDRAE